MIEPMLTDLAEAARRPSAAEQLAARVAGQAHCRVLPCTLHIGGANLKSRATCDSPVLPRSPTDVPSPCGQRRCRIHPEHCCKLQAAVIRGLQPRSDRSDYHVSACTCHRRPRSRRKPATASGTRPSCMHVIMKMPLAGPGSLWHPPSRMGRQRPPGA